MLVNLIGAAGAVVLLGSFFLSTAAFYSERIKQSSNKWAPYYSIANGFGAGMLAYYAWELHNLIFFIVESTWCVGALVPVLLKLPVKKVRPE